MTKIPAMNRVIPVTKNPENAQLNGEINATIPITIVASVITVPSMSPNAISSLFVFTDLNEIVNSGRQVPNAIIVIPIITKGIPIP